MISYCPNREDVLIWRLFKDRDPQEGFYVDVGANHPVSCSLTKWFYDQGWTGINIEPSSVFEEIAMDRTRDLNLNIAISDRREQLTFFENTDLLALSSLSSEIHENLVEQSRNRSEKIVNADMLVNIFFQYAHDREIDFLSIDVEGWERKVLDSNNWECYRPRLVIVESTEPFSNRLCHESWESILLRSRYHFACFDGINRYYVRDEDSQWLELLSYPVNVLDDYQPYELVTSRKGYSDLQAEVEILKAENCKWQLAYEDAWAGYRQSEQQLLQTPSVSPENLGTRALSKALVKAVRAKVASWIS